MARIEGVDPQTDIIPDAPGIQESSQDNGSRFDAAENSGASAPFVLVQHSGGMAFGPEGQGAAAAASHSDNTHSGTGWMSILNRRQFCRWQNVWFE